MRSVRSLVVAVLASVVLVAPAVVFADGRVALVVGNSTYTHIGRLPNADNDARDISAALRRLEFEVTTEFDTDRVELNEALRAFTRQSAGADISLVFYAGHGIEMDGVNYLVPVDARLERDVDVRFETVTVDDLLVSTSGASLRLVILDACRNNPLARSMQRTAATRTVSGGSFGDLNEDLLGDETLVAYAAAAGTTAADGRGRNSPYTAALLAQLEQPLEIGLLFRRVRAQVLAATHGAQRPHEYHSLVGEHYLTRTLATGTSLTVSATAASDPPRVAPPETDVTQLRVVGLRELAEAGNAEAQNELGQRYETGRGVPQDFGAAVALYRQATERGNARGQGNLGAMYFNGTGVQRDDTMPPSRGFVARRTAGTLVGRTVSVSCTALVAGWSATTRKLSGGTAVRSSKDTPARRTTSASGTATVAGWCRTTGRLSDGSVARPSRATPVDRTTSASCMGAAAVCAKTTRNRCVGTAARQNREMRSRRATSASVTVTVSGWRRTTGKLSDGSGDPPTRDTPAGRPASAPCTARAVGWGGITRRPSAGSAARPNRAPPPGR